MNIIEEGVMVVFPSDKKGVMSCGHGTKFYTEDGTELRNVSSFEITKTGPDDILSVTLTFPLLEVRYV